MLLSSLLFLFALFKLYAAMLQFFCQQLQKENCQNNKNTICIPHFILFSFSTESALVLFFISAYILQNSTIFLF